MHWIIKPALVMAVAVLSFNATGQEAPPPAVTNYETPGNLESTHALGCISPDQILDTYTPADLYPAAATCIINNRTEDGIYLYVVAGAYSRYDTLRVPDKTAHDAPMVLRLRSFQPVGHERMKQFDDQAVSFLDDDTNHVSICMKLLHLGPPRYFPRYMTQHGMGAFLNPKTSNHLQDIDPAGSWLTVMKDYTHCEFALPKSKSD
jgi:hypothetical protein